MFYLSHLNRKLSPLPLPICQSFLTSTQSLKLLLFQTINSAKNFLRDTGWIHAVASTFARAFTSHSRCRLVEGPPRWESLHRFPDSSAISVCKTHQGTMTEVLSMSLQPDGASLFGRSNRLRRSSSHSSFQTPFKLSTPTSYPSSPSNIRTIFSTPNYEARLPASVPSSAPSSPRFNQPEFSNLPSFASTPSSSFSLDESCSVGEDSDDDGDDEIKFPSFDNESTYEAMRQSKLDSEQSHKSPDLISSDTITPSASESSVATPSLHDFHDLQTTAGDDTAVKREPTKQVDYFSHNWKEEDIWSSWRYVVAKRKTFSNSLRLENASWRAWTKNKYRLKTVSPDSVDWYANVSSSLLERSTMDI